MQKALGLVALSLCAGVANADFTESFEGLLPDWFISNQSNPSSGVAAWGVTSNTVGGISPHSGANYAFSNFARGTGVATLSAWLIAPEVALNNGDTFSFWTRETTNNPFPDRMQVRLSTSGASINTGTSEFDVGDFSTLLLDINPTYALGGFPGTWTQYVITVSGLGAPTTGRFAFRYFVENGGPSGDNSNFIGVDDVSFTSVPAPGALALVGVGTLVVGRRRR